MGAAKATTAQTALEVLARGGAVKAHAVLLVAEAEVPRTGYLLRQVSSELRDGHTVLVADFGGADGELLAGLSRNGRSVLADVDSREGVFPLAGLRSLQAQAREAAGEILAGWLRPPGHLAESRDVRALVGLIARLPVLLPRTGLYAWRRFLIDRGFRRECVRGLRREGMDPSPLLGVRPGSVLWTVLSQRVEQVLGHDDTLDRVFPLADPAPLVEPSTVPELRIVQSQAPWAGRASRYPALLWLHLLAALASRPPFPRREGRGATDPINVALNYGYGILYAATWAAVGRAGLDPGIGMLHASPGDRGALVFDLVEPFRVPVVDRPITGLVSRGKQIKLNTDHHLTARTRQAVATAVGQALERSVPWGGTVRPLAGHIDLQAHALATWLQGGPPLRALRIRW